MNQRSFTMCFAILLLFLLGSNLSYAQFERENALILPLGELGTGYGVLPAEDDGVVLYHETKNHTNFNKRKWEITLLDFDMNFKWGTAFESELRYQISEAKYNSGYLYLLFQDFNIPTKQIFFVRVTLGTGKIEFFQISELMPRQIAGFEVIGQSIFLIGTDDQRPAILKFAFGDPRPKVLKGLFEEKNEILNISVNDKHDHIQIISKITEKGLGSVIFIKQFDENGFILRDIVLESTDNRRLLDAVALTDSDGNTAVSGVYSYGSSKFSNGVFTSVFKGQDRGKLYYYDYGNLYNIFNHLESTPKIEKEKQKYSDKKRASSFKVHHEPRQLVRQDGEWRFVGEVVQLTTSRTGTWNTDYYNYSYAIALGFDDNGKIKWDNSFSLNEKSSLHSKQQTYLQSYGEAVMMFYSDQYGMHYKLMEGNKDLVPHNVQFLDPEGTGIENKDDEQVGSQSFSHDWNFTEGINLLRWHDTTFLRFGVMEYPGLYASRKIFFIDRVILDTSPTQ